MEDEAAIRKLVEAWLEASRAGDLATVMDLMTDDVLFHVPGREAFGRDAFAAGFESLRGTTIDGTSDIREVAVRGDWGWLRNRLTVTMTPAGGEPTRRTGYTLTIVAKGADGQWRIARDANLLAPLDEG